MDSDPRIMESHPVDEYQSLVPSLIMTERGAKIVHYRNITDEANKK